MKNRIAEIRKEQNLSQRALANIIKIPYQSLQRYEKSAVVPSVDVALRLARALNTTVEELFVLEDED